MVGIACTNDIIGAITACCTVYNFVVRHYGDLSAVTQQGPPFVIFVTTMGISGAILHNYLTQRFYRLSGSIPLTAILSCFVGASVSIPEPTRTLIVVAMLILYTPRRPLLRATLHIPSVLSQ